MSGANLTNLIIGIFVAVLLVSRQMATRRLSESYRLVVTLTIQRFVLLSRVARQEAAGMLPAGPRRVLPGG